MLTMDQLSIYMRMTQSYFFIKTMEDSPTFQKDLESLTQWMETWLLRINIGNCKAISYSSRPELNTNYSISGVGV